MQDRRHVVVVLTLAATFFTARPAKADQPPQLSVGTLPYHLARVAMIEDRGRNSFEVKRLDAYIDAIYAEDQRPVTRRLIAIEQRIHRIKRSIAAINVASSHPTVREHQVKLDFLESLTPDPTANLDARTELIYELVRTLNTPELADPTVALQNTR